MTLASYPFVAVVGHSAAKHALMLLAIEPGLRGALIASPGDADERTLARSLTALLPRLSPRCAADRVRSEDDALEDIEGNGTVVQLPVNATEDRLLGGLDLERTIATGKRQISAGLLARANGGVLYVNDINLLADLSAHVAHALDSRTVRVEREGISATHDADFSFVGMFNSREGEPLSLLRDRVGLIVDSPAACSADERAEIIDRAFRFERDPLTFVDDFALETAELKSAIEDARALLPRVRVSQDQRRQISQIAISLGVEGNRADGFALKAARANAALAGRNGVTEDDMLIAIQFVLAPRAITLPLREESKQENESSPADSAEEDNNRSDVEDGSRDSIPGAVDDVNVETIDALVPGDLLSTTQRTARPARVGKRFKASQSTRGRYIRSTINPPRDARIAIDATLRAASPFQLYRRVQSELNRPESSSKYRRQPAAPRSEPQKKQTQPEGRALNSAVLMNQDRRVKIEPKDLRFKEFKHRSGILFIFAVDASGSMAVNRMAQAKGALTRLLQQAYLHRDKVALISFRGERSDVLLAPTRSVELAKRLVDALPAGGGTPLSAALVDTIELARLARLRGTSQAMLVLFTDGRANVGLRDGQTTGTRATIGEELRQIGAKLLADEISSVVVDTKSRFVSSGEGEALARLLGARYFYLPRSGAGAVYDAIKSITRRPNENQ